MADTLSKNRTQDPQVLLSLLDSKLHKAIELDQIITLSSDLLKDKLDGLRLTSEISGELNERLESIISNSLENANLLRIVRRKLNDLSASMSDSS